MYNKYGVYVCMYIIRWMRKVAGGVRASASHPVCRESVWLSFCLCLSFSRPSLYVRPPLEDQAA